MVEKKPFEDIHNPKYTFYKLVFDGKCQFDKFCEEVKVVAKDNKSFAKMVARMEAYDRAQLLPRTKFNSIHGTGCENVFEFKEDILRVYVVIEYCLQEVYIALGGKKAEQEKSIKKLSDLLSDFDANKLTLWEEKK